MRLTGLCVVWSLACGDGADQVALVEVGAGVMVPGEAVTLTPDVVEVQDVPASDLESTETGSDDVAVIPDVVVIKPEPPLPGAAGACTTRAVLECGGHAEGYLQGASAVTAWGCGLWPVELPESPEHSVTLWSAAETVATLRLTRDLSDAHSLYARLLGATPDGCQPGACTAFTAETRFVLKAGQVRYAAVESWNEEPGDWSLDLTCCTPVCPAGACGDDGCGGSCGTCPTPDVCTPSCAGKACGPDGCGGACGACGAGAVCRLDGTCVAPVFAGNDTCASATVVAALPFEAVGTTQGATDSLSPSGDPSLAVVPLDGCIRTETGGRDVVYRVTAPVALTLRARLEPLVPEAACGGPGLPTCPPSVLYVAGACPVESCLAAGDFLATGSGDLVVPMTKGQSVYLVVDGHDATEAGPFHLTVSSD